MHIALLLIFSVIVLLPTPGCCGEGGVLDRYQNNAQQLIDRIKNKISLNRKPTKKQ